MNHRTVAELARHDGVGGGFHMVVANRRVGTYPVGYCTGHPGHPTEDAARECFTRYERDHVRDRGETGPWGQCHVERCDAPARHHYDIEGDGYATARLCADHASIDQARDILAPDVPAGDAWFS